MLNPEEIYHAVIDAGNDYADKKSAYEALDDVTKSVLADIMSDFMDGKMTRTEAEMRALASSRYKTHLASLQAARRAWLFSQVRYDSTRLLADLRRSEESTKRAEMTLR